MNRKTSLLVLFVLMVTLSAACGSISGFVGQDASKPTPPSTVATPTSPPATGAITGKLGYPSEGIPALHIVAFLYGTDTYFSVDTPANQSTYQLDGLVPGNYHVVAYTAHSESIPAASGGYTQAVLCGMGEACSDHSMLAVQVVAGEMAANIDLLDWSAPLPPSPQPGMLVEGAITGQLSYPSEFIPPEKVVAFRVSDGQPFSLMTQMNQGTYVLPVPAGIYHVVAYVGGGPDVPAGSTGGYSQAVPCGLSVDCIDHSLIDVTVVQGSVTSGVNPGDFYAPEGSFPPAP